MEKKKSPFKAGFDVLFSGNFETDKQLDKTIISSLKKKGRIAVIVVYNKGNMTREIRVFPVSAADRTLTEKEQLLLGKIIFCANIYIMLRSVAIEVGTKEKWAGKKTGNPVFDYNHFHLKLASDIEVDGLTQLISTQLSI